MNKVVLQLWEESERGFESRPDGCSIHIDIENRNKYIKSIYDLRIGKEVPEVYERVVGSEVEAFIDDELFKKLNIEKSLRLIEPELNNLIKFEEIIIK
jgi:hypothetical protein